MYQLGVFISGGWQAGNTVGTSVMVFVSFTALPKTLVQQGCVAEGFFEWKSLAKSFISLKSFFILPSLYLTS